MKTLIAIIATTFAATAANALESHYGTIVYSQGEYHCVYENDGAPKNMKWVYFAMERRAGRGDSRDFSVQRKVDEVVDSGSTISAGSGLDARYVGWYCKFLERHSHHPAPPVVPTSN
ncbi:hypothetical protein [Bdellovibrio sp. HCB337]|uniref:hypothetical protein n=1 Tax=Bdellovibrio sp. HCB337 TaxID=3394358 RepID=UPI0039A4FC0A